MAADRGARGSGIDITPAFVAIARGHTPERDFRLGSRPCADDTFDLVTGFNAFFYAEDLVEAHRVAKHGAQLAMTAFGQAENGDSGPRFELLAEALPAFALEEDDGPPLERFLEEVGFTVELSEYRDNPSATRTSTR